MKEIGGFFELELNHGEGFHTSALRLNLGRTSFEYILRTKQIEKVYLPYYTCDVILEPLKKLSIKYEFYHINNNLEPVFNYNSIKCNEFFLYTNYFGLKDFFINKISNKVRNLIIDNAQAFFSIPVPGIDTFYSPRKFFGVPDGGYLYTNKKLLKKISKDISLTRFEHLIGRIESTGHDYYLNFKKNENTLSKQPLKFMSSITQQLLMNIDYTNVIKKRKANFNYIHKNLESINLLRFNLLEEHVPMVYPLYLNTEHIKQRLVENGIYVATYWPNVIENCHKSSIEFNLAKHLIPIPIDQRYNEHDMSKIIKVLNRYI